MNTFQSMTRKEISMLQNRMTYIEQLVEKISTALDNSQKIFTTWQKEEKVVPKTKKTDDIWTKITEYIRVSLQVKNRGDDTMKCII